MSTTKTDTAIFLETLLSPDEQLRHRSLDSLCEGLNADELLAAAETLDRFRRGSENLYHQVRALFFLTAIYRYHLPPLLDETHRSTLPLSIYTQLLQRRNREAIDALLQLQRDEGCTHLIASSLSRAYHQLAFGRLADQVRRSVRTVRGNQWMFRIGHPADQPLRIDHRLLQVDERTGLMPVLHEQTAVRMDFSHSGWSDIFFLGMDYPEGARVINASIDLGVHGRDEKPRPPVQAFVRVIDRPVLKLVSVDLGAEATISEIDDVFDFAKDYLGLLKAAVIAAGLVPPAMEGCHRPMSELMRKLLGSPSLGLEVVSVVNDIPKGSRLAVSTNLLGCLIAALMRATGQVAGFTAPLSHDELRLVTARAILGEWLGGSGGGWQDSGGIWPGIKLISGARAAEGDPEFGISHGRLLPQHRLLASDDIPPAARRKLEASLVLVYGGMAQNVGPILEMVTEKYLLRSGDEWTARQRAIAILDEMLQALKSGNIRRVGELTTENFTGPLQRIIPWCTNAYTDRLIEQCRERWGDNFWGFWMLGGMSGGGMGFLFDPQVRSDAEPWLADCLVQTKRQMEGQIAFAMDPLIYDFAINDAGTSAKLLQGEQAILPQGYYAIEAPKWLRTGVSVLSPRVQREWMLVSEQLRSGAPSDWLLQRLLPESGDGGERSESLGELLAENGFDPIMHDSLRQGLLDGRFGLAQNRLPPQTPIEDVSEQHYTDLRQPGDHRPRRQLGQAAILDGQVAVVTLAAGAGSRWTGGAGVVKGLHPFIKLGEQHRSFVEIHLAKTQAVTRLMRTRIPHVLTTSYLTHSPTEEYLSRHDNFGQGDSVYLSRGQSVGLRMIPTARDLRFLWQEMPQQILDQQQQKVRESAQAALLQWAIRTGEATDYTDNTPKQCMHPVGHWYEIPNLMLNGVLARMLADQPSLKYLLLHNIDTLGATIDPIPLGAHIESGATLSFEVITRRIDDHGGGLACVGGRPRLIEGLATPSEQDALKLSLYNSLTTWITIDALLRHFELTRDDLNDSGKVREAVRRMAARLPIYITVKDVKKRWGQGQEDVYPVCQFEQLWGDMTSLPDIACHYLAVPIRRGQQLKDVDQLDGWVRDGSAAAVAAACEFSRHH